MSSAPTTEKRLTDYADCAGCASKLPAAELDRIMTDLPMSADDRVLVDFRTSDDAGVYRWSADSALVQTVDFFTPIVDDPYVFGQVAAANALSDVYAMGGIPRTALAIAALPKDGPSPEVVRSIFKGGADKLREAGVALLGGHTVSDPEIKFGYSVTGEVAPDRVLTNARAKVGQLLVLTKPLGTGIIVRATRFGRSTENQLSAAVASMVELNRSAGEVAASFGPGLIGACTDVTGFGLAGHSCEIASASGTTLVIRAADLPVLTGAADLAVEFLPCGGRSNKKHFASVTMSPGVPLPLFLLTLDPQTSGGLLLAVDAAAAPRLMADLASAGVNAHVIGSVVDRDPSGALVRVE